MIAIVSLVGAVVMTSLVIIGIPGLVLVLKDGGEGAGAVGAFVLFFTGMAIWLWVSPPDPTAKQRCEKRYASVWVEKDSTIEVNGKQLIIDDDICTHVVIPS